MKIVYLDAFPLGEDIDTSALEELGDYISYDRTAVSEIVTRAKDAEIILTNKCLISSETMQELPNLKYIGVTATGYNIVDTAAAKEQGIIVTNVSDYSTNSVAQHVFSLLLRWENRVYEHSSPQKWIKSPDFCYFNSIIHELNGKTLGLIGYGNIGKKVGEIAEAFGMNLLINKKTPDKFDPRMMELDQLVEQSDFISLHLPLTPDNGQFVNKELIAKMKKTSFIVNTARGGLINEQDLADALNSGVIAGAALDVLSVEPPTLDNPLLSAQNCLITPHIAWGSFEARKKLLEIAVDNIRAFQSGHPKNVVSN